MVSVNRRPYPLADIDFADFRTCLREFVLPGHTPEAPFLDRRAKIFTQGSCFAENIHSAFVTAGIRSLYSSFLEQANSPLANRLYLEYALAGLPYRTQLHEGSYSKSIPDNARALRAVSMVVFTVGVAWVPMIDGDLASSFTAADIPRITWRLTNVTENVDHLARIIDVIQTANPGAAVVLTVSPIPIKNAFGSESAIVADCMSKTNLRAAVTEVMLQKKPGVYYWPSFEAIRWLSGHMGPFYGVDGADQRHVGSGYIDVIVSEFIRAFFKADQE